MAIFTGIAAAIGGAFTAVSTFIGGLGVVGSFVLKTAVGVGLNLLASKLAGKPQSGASFSTNGKLQGGGDVPRSAGLGYYATAGSLVYANTWGNAGKTPNAYLTQVIALSDLPIQSLVELWVGSEKVTIEGTADGNFGFPIAQYRKNGVAHMWVKFYDGTQTVADPLCVQKVSSAARPYQSTRVGRGVAYAVVTAYVGKDSGLFQGMPSYKFGLHGMRLYDPSRDSTRGGSGTQRLDDPATWGGDGDHLPAVQAYNLLLGLKYAGVWQYGLQNVAAARLPTAFWIAQINVCRTVVAGPNGVEPQFRSGGEIPFEAPIGDALEAIITAGNGRASEIGGFYKFHFGAPPAPAATIDDGVILSTEGQTFTPFMGLADTINGIVATYPNPAEGWAAKPAPALYSPEFEAQDGNRRLLADVPLDFVPYPGQVQRLMKAALAEARRARRHTITLPPEFWVLEPGDVLTWTSARNGYQAKQFRIDGVVDKGNLDVLLDITEIDPTDYDWNQNTDYRTPVDGPVGPIRPAPQVIVDWFAEGTALTDEDGNLRRPAIHLSWDGDQPDVAAVAFEIRLAATGVVVYRGRTDNPAAGSILITQNLLPNTAYEVRGRYIPKSDRETLWSGWLAVTTPDVRLTDEDVYLPGLVQEITGQIGSLTDFATSGTREAIERLRQLALDEENEAAASYTDRQVIRKETALQIGAARAYVSETLLLAIGPDGVITARLNEMEAEFGDGLSGINQLVQTEVSRINGALTATADLVNALSAQVGDVSSSVNLRAQAVASGQAGVARWMVQVQSGAPGQYVTSALFLEADSNGIGSAGFLADRFFIANPAQPGQTLQPFVFQNNEAIMNLARIGTLRAGTILALNDKFKMTLDTGTLEWWD